MGSVRDPGLRPFNDSGYEILDEDLLTRGEVIIWSLAPLHPRIGDLYMVECGGGVHEVEVASLALVKGGWSARCRLYGLLS